MSTRHNTEAQILQARRTALEGKRFQITFYGGWYVIDNHSETTKSHETMSAALGAAEAMNAFHS